MSSPRRRPPLQMRCEALASGNQSAATRAGQPCEWRAYERVGDYDLCFTHARAYVDGMPVRLQPKKARE